MADHNNAKDAVTAWLNESEVFSLRIERLHEDAASGNDLVPWLVEAFRLGADRAAPEGQGYFGPMGIPHWSSALTPPPAAPTDNAALVEAALGMKRIVEEIDGVMKHGTWRDERGKRLKDTPEWVAFYNALASREAPPAAQEPEPVGCLHGYCNAENCPACSQEEQEAPPACQQEAGTVAEAAQVLLDQPYEVMRRAFAAMERMQGEGADNIMAAALRALKGERG